MSVLDVCKNYFNGFQQASDFRKNDSITNVFAVLKIFSYFTVVIPLSFAAAYGTASLCGRVSKKKNLSSHDKIINNKLNETILENRSPVSSFNNKQVYIDEFNQKILQSATVNKSELGDKDKSQEALTKEIDKFNQFLKKPSVGSHDIVYVCIGAGSELGQVWPGFIFESLEKGQAVKTIVFETLNSDMTAGAPKKDFYDQMRALYHTSYKALPDQPLEEVPFLGDLEKKYEFHQFLCGYPDTESSVEKTDPQIYKIIANVYWPTIKQLADARVAFEKYIQKELEAGTSVVLGDHRGWLQADNIMLYNKLVNAFPGKVHFLWAWGNCNLMTSTHLTVADCEPEKKEQPWIHYENLGKCLIE